MLKLLFNNDESGSVVWTRGDKSLDRVAHSF